MHTTRDDHETGAVVAAARAGDQSAFTELVGRHRRELQVHCYRMLGSLEDSEDLVQETFLRAWRGRESYAGRASFRAWLYRIATNACLDTIAQRARRPVPAAGSSEIPWLQPYPDHLLERVAADDDEPDAAVVEKETIELAFMVAIQHLAPRPRAVLILRDVLGWPAKDAADLLGITVNGVNSALQRARAGLKEHLPQRRLEWAAGQEPDKREQELLERYVRAGEEGDAAAFVQMLHEDARFSMPPQPGVWTGNAAIVAAWQEGGFGSEGFGRMRCVLTAANRQPAVACYVRRPGQDVFRPMAIDVMRVEDGKVAEIITFMPSLFAAFGLSPTL